MPAVRSALVVGGGLAGAATAIGLAPAGVAVDLVEIKPDAAATGSGITLQGNALRVLRDLGVWSQCAERGYAFDSLGIRAPDPNATLVAELPDVHTGGPDLPGTMGMDRRVLARILLERAQQAGAKIRFATTLTSLVQDEHGVDVEFSDGAARRYDVVVGADGVRSWTRRTLGIPLETRATGMGIWRIFGPRPAQVTRTDLTYSGVCYIAGYCPTGENSLYAYLVEDAQDRSGLGPEQKLAAVKELAGNYHGAWDDIRAGLTDPSQVNYTWFETHLLDAPWNRGRVVLIGDAAHCCPPTLAQGGAMALEDAAVLCELLIEHSSTNGRLWQELTDRRFARASAIVAASVQLGQWMLDHEQDVDVPGLMGSVSTLVTDPA